MLGTGPELNNLKILLPSITCRKKYTLRYNENPNTYLNEYDLFVLFSSWEGMPNVVLDALYTDIDIIVSDAPGGAPELVDYGKYGRIVGCEDTDQLFNAMLDAFHKKWRPAQGKYNHIEQYRIDHITTLYE